MSVATARKPFEPLPVRGTGHIVGMPRRARVVTIALTDNGRDAAHKLAMERGYHLATIIGVVVDEIIASGKLAETFDAALKRGGRS